MRVYLAGVPGGGVKASEDTLIRLEVKNRLMTFFYRSETIYTIELWKKGENDEAFRTITH